MKRPSSFLKNLQFLNLNIKAKEIRDWVMTLSVWLLTHFRCVWLFVTLWTVAHHVPLSMEFSRQEYWSGFSCPMGSSQPKNQTCFSSRKEMATYTSVLAWRIPGMGEPGGLPSMGSHRVGHDWSDLAAAAYLGYMLISNNNIIYII